MENNGRYEVDLRHGRTDGDNLPGMIEKKFYSTGYNSTRGLVNVAEDNGDFIFEGEVNIENELPRMLLEAESPSPGNVDQYLTNRDKLRKLEHKLADSNPDPKIDLAEIKLKIKGCKDELGFDFKKVDSAVDEYMMSAYNNWANYTTNPGNYAEPPNPILEVLTDKR